MKVWLIFSQSYLIKCELLAMFMLNIEPPDLLLYLLPIPLRLLPLLLRSTPLLLVELKQHPFEFGYAIFLELDTLFKLVPPLLLW